MGNDCLFRLPHAKKITPDYFSSATTDVFTATTFPGNGLVHCGPVKTKLHRWNNSQRNFQVSETDQLCQELISAHHISSSEVCPSVG